MAETTWTAEPIAAWLAEQAIAVRVNAAEQPALAQRFKIERTPAVVLLDSDGQERDCILGYRDESRMLQELRSAARGENAEQRARAQIARGGPTEAPARQRLAEILMRSGDHDAALRELLWCYDEGLARDMVYAAMQRRQLIFLLGQLARKHEPAAAAMRERRAAGAARLGERDDVNAARNVALICQELGDLAWLEEQFDKSPDRDSARRIFAGPLFDLLIEKRRYSDLLELIEPVDEFRQQVQSARTGGGMACCAVHAPQGVAVSGFVVERGARLVELLATANRREDAARLIRELLQLEDSPEVRKTVRERLQRADRGDWASLVDAVPEATPASRPAK